MELGEKIQALRKERGLTQEQFAERLFVSRTAVSKWETGRGIPSMESLTMMAKFFGITLDELLSAEEVIAVAKQENSDNLRRVVAFGDGLCNTAAVMGLLLPLYKVQRDQAFLAVPLYQLDGWLTVLYWVFPALMILCGVLQLVINRKECDAFKRVLRTAGFVLSVGAVVLLIISGQPYPAVLFLGLLLAKGAILLIKRT